MVLMMVDEICYLINVGDSRGVMSAGGGRYSVEISKDHKPGEPTEQTRI